MVDEPVIEPITWQALQTIKSAIEDITIANGYRTDIGAGTIYDDRAQIPEEGGEFTLIAAGDMPINEQGSGLRTTATDMEISIEYAQPMTGDTNRELLAHRARADIIRALQGDLRDKPFGLRSLKVTGSQILARPEGASLLITQVSARAGLSESKSPANS